MTEKRLMKCMLSLYRTLILASVSNSARLFRFTVTKNEIKLIQMSVSNRYSQKYLLVDSNLCGDQLLGSKL